MTALQDLPGCIGCSRDGFQKHQMGCRWYGQNGAAMTTPDAAMLWVAANIHVPCNDARRDFAEAHRAGQSHIAARLRERADAATGSAQAVMYEIARMIEAGEL